MYSQNPYSVKVLSLSNYNLIVAVYLSNTCINASKLFCKTTCLFVIRFYCGV